MKCIILAAGYATRLYPLTENFPKPLLKVKEKTILDWLIDDINSLKKIEEYIIISNHKFINHFNTWKENRKMDNIRVLDDGSISNETRVGAVADILFAINSLNLNDDLLVIAGDNVLDFSFKKFVSYFGKKKHSIIMRYYEEDKNKIKKSACVVVNEQDQVMEMIEKPANPLSNWCVPPFYLYSKKDIKLIQKAIDDGCNKDTPGALVNWMYDKTKMYAMEMPGKRYDVGTLESYSLVNEIYEGINY